MPTKPGVSATGQMSGRTWPWGEGTGPLTLGRTCSENRTEIQQMSQVGLGIPQNWEVGREPDWFSVSKARMM